VAWRWSSRAGGISGTEGRPLSSDPTSGASFAEDGPPSKSRATFWLLLLLALPVFFLFLGANSIWDANEAFYVETPRQMVLTGDYLRPSFNGLERFNKPVLSYWVVAGLYQLFGISVTVERVGIALGAMGMLLAAFLIGRALRSTTTGIIAALLMATAPRVVFFSRRIFIDVYITLFMALTLACFLLAERSPRHRTRYLLLMYVAIGLGVLTKGPVALGLPAVVFALWLFVERRLSDIRRLHLVAGAAIVLAIVAPWYVAVGLYEEHGWQHVRDFLLLENVGRFASSMTTERSPFFFLGVLFFDFLLPWAPLLVVAAAAEWQRRRARAGGDPLRTLLWLWIVVIVGAFSVSASKEDLYIFSVVPAAAALIAESLIGTEFGVRHRAMRYGLAAIAAGFVVLAVGVRLYLGSGYYELPSATALALVLAAAGIAATVLMRRGRPATGFVLLAGGCIALNYLLVMRVLPDLERLKPVPGIAETIRARGTRNAQIGSVNMDLPSLVFYADQSVTALDGTPHAVQFFRQYPEPWVVMGNREWEVLQQAVPNLCIVKKTPLFETRLSDIVRGTPPPDVLLGAKCK
jgi:4-amino-4-deoxy-L-arabinose transferase-like glycosyltransferase